MAFPLRLNSVVAFLVVLGAAAPLYGTTIPLLPGDFVGTPLIDFASGAAGSPITGQTFAGATFTYLVNGAPSNDAILDGGPGLTNNVNPLNIVNQASGNANSVLSIVFPALETRMGYGYALLFTGPVAGATSVALYGATNTLVGTLSANGNSDPTFTGGFLGVQSDIPFRRADVTFSAIGAAFAFDNLRFANTLASPVPEPGTVLLIGAGLAIGRRRLRRAFARKPRFK
jgi:hypothetical protein